MIPPLNFSDSQLTIQEVSPMIRLGLKPIIFLLNNSGYTIERFLHGKERYVEHIYQFYLDLNLMVTQEIQ